MKIIYLPGFSLKNKQAAEELRVEFKQAGLELDYMSWEHWETGATEFDFNKECVKLLEFVDDQDYIIIAKSIGTELVTNMIQREELPNLKFLVLMGIPSQKQEYIDILSKHPKDDLLVIQNDKDPYQTYEDLKKFLKAGNVEIEIINGGRDDHSYPFAEVIIDKIKPHLK